MTRTALTLALLVLAAPAFAQQSGSPAQDQAKTGAADAATKQFVQKAAMSDMYEIAAGQIASDKSNNQQFDQFARHMVDEHTKTSKELTALVQNMQGMEMPKSLDAEHQKKLDTLKSANDAQFHREYRSQQIAAHKTAVSLFSDYAKNGKHAELKSWADKTLPHLQKHLEMAQALPENVQQSPAVSQSRERAPNQAQNQAQNQSQDRSQNQAQNQQRVGGQRAGNVLAQPGPGQILASDLEGTTVYGANNEKIGDISDTLLDSQGRVVAVIVGVGGFLGIGEKNVAIPFSALERIGSERGATTGTAQPSDSGTMKPDRIVLKGMTKADLEAAPNFNENNSSNNNRNNNNNNSNRR